MSFKIVRNDITRMDTEAIVNTANTKVAVGAGCDLAVYRAAGYQELLDYRREYIGEVPEGEAFLTPGFGLAAKYIIHAVSPRYSGGEAGEETKLRACYRHCLKIAKEKEIRSIAFPLISTGGFGYPKEEGMRIAIDEINAFLLGQEMDVVLVVFDAHATRMGERVDAALEAYIDQNYVRVKKIEEYDRACEEDSFFLREERMSLRAMPVLRDINPACAMPGQIFEEKQESELKERMNHISDTFSQYLMYLIHAKGLENAEVYKRAIVDKKIFSKIKNHMDYHPQKLTALCLCVGAMLNLDETKDLLARAGYALSPCDKIDIIFSYFIENEIYDMIELDIQLEEHGLPCIIA